MTIIWWDWRLPYPWWVGSAPSLDPRPCPPSPSTPPLFSLPPTRRKGVFTF
jgi:hypothetical protein